MLVMAVFLSMDALIFFLRKLIFSFTSFVNSIVDCAYLERLFKERQQEYYAAQRKYADYVDAHDNVESSFTFEVRYPIIYSCNL